MKGPAFFNAVDARWATCLALLALLGLFWIVQSPSDVDDNEQPITMAHFMDVAIHGHWLSQSNPFEGLSTKPPAYHWLGGLSVKILGPTSELVFRLPSAICFLVTCILVVMLARTCLPRRAAWLAGCIWVANFHVLKLAGTIRPDMMLAMFMTAGLLALQMIRLGSSDHPSANTPGPERTAWQVSDKQSIAWWFVLWLSIAMAGLTKGPVALILALMVFVMLWWDRQLMTRHTFWHAMGLLMAVSIVLGWLGLAMMLDERWQQVLDKELWARLLGDGTGVKSYPPRWREMVYFIGRFIPWSVLTVAGMVMINWWRRRQPQGLGRHVSWAALWLLVMLGVLALPAGRRADHILPVYSAAAVLAAAVVLEAQRRKPAPQLVTHLFLGGICLAGLGAAVGIWWVDRPAAMRWVVMAVEPVVSTAHYETMIAMAAGLSALAGAAGLWLLHQRRYLQAGLIASAVMLAIIGMFQFTLNRDCQNRNGDQMIVFAQTAARELAQTNRHAMYYDTGYVPVQSLLGDQLPMRTYDAQPADDVLLITSERGWELLKQQGSAGHVLLQTPRLEESGVSLMLINPATLPDNAAMQHAESEAKHQQRTAARRLKP